MKRIFLVLVAVLAIGSVSAQAVWGLRAGVSRPTVTVSGDGASASLDGKFGLEVGPVVYYSLKNNFYVNSGLLFSMKSFDFGDESLDMYYLNVPLYLGYSIPLGDLSTYAQVGPYIGFKVSESEESGLNSFDAGIGAMYGININRFKIEVGYQYGLTNALKDAEDIKANLGSLFLGVSYVF